MPMRGKKHEKESRKLRREYGGFTQIGKERWLGERVD